MTRGVQVSELELNTRGGMTVKSLATIFEDGEVVGKSYLASSLRKAVEARGPLALESVVRLYNNGYYGASWIDKGRVYLKPGQEVPAGMRVKEGPRGGRYYETEAKRGRPLKEAPKGWKPKEGERVRLRMPGSRLNGRLGRIRENHHDKATGIDFSVVDGEGWSGGAYVNWDEGTIVPAPYTAKEKREMTAKDILVSEFGKTSIEQRPFTDDTTGLVYDIYNTEAGPMLWVKRDTGKDKPWIVTKESAVSLEAFMKSLLEMPTEALQSMKSEIQSIIFSPVSNPADRKTSQMIGAKFTSAASMDTGMRTMYIWPASKKSDAKRLAQTLTHETGHAVDRMRSDLGMLYQDGLRQFWNDLRENEGIQIPASIREQKAIEAEHGIPPDPNKWQDDWGRFKSFELGTSNPDTMYYWRSIRTEKPWNALSADDQKTIIDSVRPALPVTDYAHRNEKEYYAEAYAWYQLGALPGDHVMYNHFANLERTRRWLQQ